MLELGVFERLVQNSPRRAWRQAINDFPLRHATQPRQLPFGQLACGCDGFLTRLA